MASRKIRVAVPEELLRDIDEAVGFEHRRVFLIETAEAELRKRRLLRFLESDEPAWKDVDHPELVEMGTEAWVRSLRQQSERHFPDSEPDETPAA